ncbi:MAG: hypothetical protein ACKESB_03060 [Candidatus Hodgkinia cicadicola]
MGTKLALPTIVTSAVGAFKFMPVLEVTLTNKTGRRVTASVSSICSYSTCWIRRVRGLTWYRINNAVILHHLT